MNPIQTYNTQADKSRAISSALKRPDSIDLVQLQHFCISKFGLVSDHLRIKVWPLLLGLTPSDSPSSTPQSALHTKYAHQIDVDIQRSLNNFDIVKGISAEARKVRMGQLTRVITRLVSEDPDLHYFQGFHDICSVFLLVAGEDLGYRLIHRFAYTHCRDAMRPTFDQVSALMGLVAKIVEVHDKELGEKLVSLQQDVFDRQIPMFTLSWIITFFAHVVSSFEKVARIFDFCLGTHPLAVLYLAASLIIRSRESVLLMNDLPDLHRHFSDAVKHVDWDQTCLRAYTLMQTLPPQKLLKSLRIRLPREYVSLSSPLYVDKGHWLTKAVTRSALLATSLGSLIAFSYMRQYEFFITR